MAAPRVLIALEPELYAEGLASSLGKLRPRAEVTILDPPEGVEAAALRVRPHLIVAHRVPPEARGTSFWLEVARLVGSEPVGAEISADGYSRSVANVDTGDVLAALDRAEEELLLGPGRAQGQAQGQAQQGGQDT